MLHSYSLNMANPFAVLQVTRACIHLITLASVIAYQFLFPLFINFELSVYLYMLCAVFLFLDACYIFSFQDNKIFNKYLPPVFHCLEIIFYSVLLAIAGPMSLVLIFVFLFWEILTFCLVKDILSSLFFAILLSFFMPLSFLWHGDFSYETRKSLVVALFFALSIALIASYFLSKVLKFLQEGMKTRSSAEADILSLNSKSVTGIPLSFVRQMRAFVDLLQKTFLDAKEAGRMPTDHYENQLSDLQTFVLNYSSYSDLKGKNFSFESVNLFEMLNKALEDSKNHKDYPRDLNCNFQYKSSQKNVKVLLKPLKKSFENIIENSFQALKNRDNPQLDIETYDEGDWMVIDFTDNGQGIDKEDQRRLFEPFFSRRMRPGGLGLSYVAEVIALHNGKVEIVSTLGKGTKLSIRLPLVTDHEQRQAISA